MYQYAYIALLVVSIHTVNGQNHQLDWYQAVSPVDTTKCYQLIKQLPLKEYEFKYDSIRSRRQVGVIGQEIQHSIPGSVQVVPRQTFPNRIKGQAPIVLENFHLVDNTVLFMNNIGAVKQLIQQHEQG